MLTDKYVNLFTDFGFKKLFGEEANQDLLTDFLNQLLPPEHQITTLQFKQTEQLGSTQLDRKAIYDIYCENEKGHQFIVELQKAPLPTLPFRRGGLGWGQDRTVYYSTFPIQEQAQKGEWDFQLTAVYCIGVLDFVFEEDKKYPHKYLHRVALTEQETKKIFYDKLHFIYLEMPHFKKDETQLKTHFDKWLYFIKHLPHLQEIPSIFQEENIFLKAFEVAEIARFNRSQLMAYEQSLKYYRDMKNVIDTSFREGEQQGNEKGFDRGLQQGLQQGVKDTKHTIAQQMKAKGFDNPTIAELTGLTAEEIAQL